MLTKVDHVKDTAFSPFRHCRKHLALMVGRDGNDRVQRCPVVLDEFDTVRLLFPELDVSIDRGRDNKVGPDSQRTCEYGQAEGTAPSCRYSTYLVMVTKLIWSRCMKDL